MGSVASITPHNTGHQLKKYCPNIKDELDTHFHMQVGIGKKPVYGIDDSCGRIEPTIKWDKKLIKPNDTRPRKRKDNNHKLLEEYGRAWDYFEWFYREPLETRERIVEIIRNQRVGNFIVDPHQINTVSGSTKVLLDGSKFQGTNIDYFKETRKNYWMARMNGRDDKVRPSRRENINSFNSRRMRKISHIFSQDFMKMKSY